MNVTDFSTVDQIVNFFTECKVKRSYVKSITIKQKDDVSFQPIPKIQLIGQFQGRRTVRTIAYGIPIFPQIVASFGAKLDNDQYSAHQLAWIDSKEQTINEIFRSFMSSEVCKNQAKQENSKAKNKLIDQLRKEIFDRFELLLSFPDADHIIPDLYNQAQVERVLKL